MEYKKYKEKQRASQGCSLSKPRVPKKFGGKVFKSKKTYK